MRLLAPPGYGAPPPASWPQLSGWPNQSNYADQPSGLRGGDVELLRNLGQNPDNSHFRRYNSEYAQCQNEDKQRIDLVYHNNLHFLCNPQIHISRYEYV